MAPPTRDFAKRPKAKVGKRAPAKINSTDTSFKTASVGVRPQGKSLDKNQHATSQDASSSKASAAARMELASSRGNALSTLQASLRHHAPSVRASGMRGIRDAVQSLSSLEGTLGTSILEANLPSLLPNMCRCWLDEDDDVRSLAVNLFGDILKNLSSSLEQSDLKCLAPFVPFLCAYASSALNSLDRSIRKDGALVVGMLASSDSSPSFSTLASSSDKEGGISAMSAEMGKYVDLFIPSMERLLSSMSLGGRGKNSASSKGGAKKRKRDGKNTGQPTRATLAASDATLLSLALLVQASLASEGNALSANTNNGSTKRRLDPSLYVSGECTFLKGGSAHANSLLLFREGGRNQKELNSPVHGIFDLPAMPIDESLDGMQNKHVDEGTVLRQYSSSESDTSTLEKIQRITSLLETLRAKFVELTHTGRKSDNGKHGLIMSTGDLETVDVLVQTIQFVHRLCQSNQKLVDQHEVSKKSSQGPPARRLKRGKKAAAQNQDMGECLASYGTTVTKALTLLLETFPIWSMSSDSISRYELTNAGICSALAELGGYNVLGDSRGSSSQWIDSVFSYILPRLNSTNGTEEDSAEKSHIGAEGIATNMLLKVVSKLLLPHDCQGSDSTELTPNYLLNSPSKRYELLEAFAGAFFPRLAFPLNLVSKGQRQSHIYASSVSNEVESKMKQLASTAMGKTAAMLLTTLITQSADRLLDPPNDDQDNLHKKNTLLLLQMSSVLPVYLVSWEDTLPIETGIVLASFISISRQWAYSSDGNVSEHDSSMPIIMALNDLCVGMRCALEVLYTGEKRKPSIFEGLPEQVQKMCVGIIGLLKCPSEALTKSLSNICSRSSAQRSVPTDFEDDVVISSSMANYIMEAMSLLRKTMPMPNYLAFLIDSCGVRHATSTSMSQQKRVVEDGDSARDRLSDAAFSYDDAVGHLSHFLTTSCDQASTKVLPMIRPVLLKWLTASTSTDDAIKQIVQARAATSILAAFTWDEVLSHGSLQSKSDFVAPKFLDLDEKFDQLLVDCTIEQLELSARLWSMGEGGYMDDLVAQQQYLARLLGPITLLLRYRREMFEQFVKKVCGRVVQQSQVKQEGRGSKPSGEDSSGKEHGDSPSKKFNVAEVHMKALLVVLKSKAPASIVDLVRSSSVSQTTLLSCTETIEKSVSGGHLAHLGNKLVYQAKLFSKG